MDVEEQIRRGLHGSADGLDPDLARNLAAVRRKVRRRNTRRRVAGVVTVAVVAVGVLAVGARIPDWVSGSPKIGPATQSPSPNVPATVPNPFSIKETFSAASIGMTHPLRVAVSPNGEFYVSDKSQTITEVTPAGRVVRRFGEPGADLGEFLTVSGAIAVGSDGRVFIADTRNSRVLVYSSTGTYLAQLGTRGTGKGQFLRPSDVVVDAQGNVYVADARAGTVTKLSPAGTQLWRFGGAATKDADLVGTEHFAGFTDAGLLVMANEDRGRVVYVDRAGHKVDAFGSGPQGACDAATDGQGFVYVTGCQETDAVSSTELYDSDHQLVGAWSQSTFASAPRFGQGGIGVAVAHDGSLLEVGVSRH